LFYFRKSDSHYNLGRVVGCSSGSFYILFCFVSGSLIAIIILAVLLAVVVVVFLFYFVLLIKYKNYNYYSQQHRQDYNGYQTS
jgi:uncharacterized membrane protein